MLVRVDGIGDALACTPLIAALREGGHSVSALLSTGNAEIFSRRVFEHVHVVDRIPWPKHGYTPRTWDAALQAARHAQYDVALVASEEPLAYEFARRAGVAKRVGFHNGWQKPFKSWWTRRVLTRAIYRSAAQPDHPRHEVEVLFDLGAGLHTERRPTKDTARLRPIILDDEIAPGKTRLIQISAKWLAPRRDEVRVRRWFAALAARGTWIGICSQAEREVGARLGEAAGLRVEYFDSVKDWKEAIARSSHLVTPDTGAAHVAGMLGVRCTVFFEAHRYESQVLQWAPWATTCTVAQFPDGGTRAG